LVFIALPAEDIVVWFPSIRLEFGGSRRSGILVWKPIPVTSNATTRLRLELLEAEKRDEEGVKACARVRSRIVETGKEYLPKGEVLTERCVLTSQPRVPAARSINWIGVADAISRISHKKDSLTDAYAEALSEVIATLERRLAR